MILDCNNHLSYFYMKEKQLQNCQKDSGKMSEELNSHMVKVKWAQNKLKQELENHKVSLTIVKCIHCTCTKKVCGHDGRT